MMPRNGKFKHLKINCMVPRTLISHMGLLTYGAEEGLKSISGPTLKQIQDTLCTPLVHLADKELSIGMDHTGFKSHFIGSTMGQSLSLRNGLSPKITRRCLSPTKPLKSSCRLRNKCLFNTPYTVV